MSPGAVEDVELRPDDLLTVTDVEGGQVGDLFAYVAGSQNEYLSASHTLARDWRAVPRIRGGVRHKPTPTDTVLGT